MSEAAKRTAPFSRNERLDNLISELRDLLLPVQISKQQDFERCRWPVGFIVGVPRSGTTLVLQWLASLGVFSYPTNVMNRFAYAPYIGAMLQCIFTDPAYDAFGELHVSDEHNYESFLGKTSGPGMVNEFQFFFRNYLPNFVPRVLTAEELDAINWREMERGLASIESVLEKPFALKAIMLQFNLSWFLGRLDRHICIYVRRDPSEIMCSILRARKTYYGDYETWWSVRPAEYDDLKDMDVFHQVAGQVFYTRVAIERELEMIAPSRRLTIDYEAFCKAPAEVYDRLVGLYSQNGCSICSDYNGVRSFRKSNGAGLPVAWIEKLKRAYDFFEKSYNGGI